MFLQLQISLSQGSQGCLIVKRGLHGPAFFDTKRNDVKEITAFKLFSGLLNLILLNS